jgi:hypothetical protein
VEQKIKDKRKAPPVCPASAHEEADNLKIYLLLKVKEEEPVSCYATQREALLFRLVYLLELCFLLAAKKRRR